MRDRDLARSVKAESARAAQETRAFRRGVVESVNGDGRAVVILPNGKKILVVSANSYEPAEGQSVGMTRNGQQWEIFADSAYGGGNGSPFSTP